MSNRNIYLKCLNNINDEYIMVCNAYNEYINRKMIEYAYEKGGVFMESKYVDYNQKVLQK